jgi:RHS repeat-associated protein
VVTSESGSKEEGNDDYPYGLELLPDSGVIGSRSWAKFTVHTRDKQTGIDDMKMREKPDRLPRFLSVDLVDDVLHVNPTTWNRFAYVHGDPVRLADPYGLAGYDPKSCKEAGGTPTLINGEWWCIFVTDVDKSKDKSNGGGAGSFSLFLWSSLTRFYVLFYDPRFRDFRDWAAGSNIWSAEFKWTHIEIDCPNTSDNPLATPESAILNTVLFGEPQSWQNAGTIVSAIDAGVGLGTDLWTGANLAATGVSGGTSTPVTVPLAGLGVVGRIIKTGTIGTAGNAMGIIAELKSGQTTLTSLSFGPNTLNNIPQFFVGLFPVAGSAAKITDIAGGWPFRCRKR